MKRWDTNNRDGFTIVELLIVVVVIAILAAITIVSYNGIQQRAKESALQSDLRQAKVFIEKYKIENADTYPADASAFPKSASTIYEYSHWSGGFYLTARTAGVSSYSVSSTGSVQKGPAPGHEYGYPAPAGENIAPPIALWTPNGAATVSETEGYLASPGSPAVRLRSPFVRVDEATSITLRWEALHPTASRFQWNSYYFAEDKTTPVNNTAGYSSNGHAPLQVPLNTWTEQSTSFALGPGIVYVRFDASTNATFTGPASIRNIRMTLIR